MSSTPLPRGLSPSPSPTTRHQTCSGPDTSRRCGGASSSPIATGKNLGLLLIALFQTIGLNIGGVEDLKFQIQKLVFWDLGGQVRLKDKKMGRGLPRIEHPPATPKKNPFDDGQ
nr:30S ribosomal protein S31, chloroplastic [Ipomoea batatas]